MYVLEIIYEWQVFWEEHLFLSFAAGLFVFVLVGKMVSLYDKKVSHD